MEGIFLRYICISKNALAQRLLQETWGCCSAAGGVGAEKKKNRPLRQDLQPLTHSHMKIPAIKNKLTYHTYRIIPPYSNFITMKKITLFLAIMIISISARAQSYVTIPDPYFVSWLNINIPSAMMGNQMDTTSTAVTSLTSMNISNDSIFDL